MSLRLSQIDVWYEVECRRRAVERTEYVLDTAGAIGGAFSEKGVTEYISQIG
jgi:hypothetical protein